jgi:ParB-like chromosome segregation protein Spo0J
MQSNPAVPNRDHRISVVYRALDQLKPDPRNARCHSRKQIRQIVGSIEAFGFNVPILVNAELEVIAGHGRLLACRELGRAEVPASIPLRTGHRRG